MEQNYVIVSLCIGILFIFKGSTCRPIISKFTEPIFAKFSGLVELRQYMTNTTQQNTTLYSTSCHRAVTIESTHSRVGDVDLPSSNRPVARS